MNRPSPRDAPEPAQPDIVELRIHGVSGGSATELLDVPPVKRVGGDTLAGFFQQRGEADGETRPGVLREVFAWGRLTSGAPTRALWLLLLPFLLVNLAYWMRPRRLGPGSSRRHLWANHAYGAVVRLLALSLTALLLAAAGGVGMDLVAWQCGGHGSECAELRPWLGFLAAPGAPLATTGTALGLGALLPLAVLIVLWRLSRRTGRRFEAVNPTVDRPATPAVSPITEQTAPLGDPSFWRGFRLAAGLRCLHIAVACCVIAALLVIAPLSWDVDPGARAAGAGLATLLGVLLAGCVVLVGVPDRAWYGWADTAGRRVRDLALVALVLSAAYAVLWPRPGWVATGALPGLGSLLNLLFLSQAVLVLALALLAVGLYRGSGARRHTAMRGMAGPATGTLGVVLGAVFSTVVGAQAPEWLGGCLYPGAEEAGCLTFHAPVSYAWIQLASTLVAVTLGTVGPLLWLLERRRRARARRVATATYPDWDQQPQRQAEIVRALARGQLTERLPAVLVLVLSPMVALLAVTLVAGLGGQLAPLPGDGGHARLSPQALSVWGPDWLRLTLDWLIPAGSILGTALLAGLLWLGRTAYQDEPTRQALGVVWDIGTFWPRAAHPLAPPCYAERAVPQLACRVTELTEGGTAVVLSGHSQGSVLAAAAVWQLPGRCRDQLALLTHGSPLYRLYARYFPSYFGPAALGDLAGRVSHWRNLWRETDPIGGPVRLAEGTVPDERPLPDPRSLRRAPGEALPDPVAGHSWYTRDPAYAVGLWQLVGGIVGRDGSAPRQWHEPRAPRTRSEA